MTIPHGNNLHGNNLQGSNNRSLLVVIYKVKARLYSVF